MREKGKSYNMNNSEYLMHIMTYCVDNTVLYVRLKFAKRSEIKCSDEKIQNKNKYKNILFHLRKYFLAIYSWLLTFFSLDCQIKK